MWKDLVDFVRVLLSGIAVWVLYNIVGFELTLLFVITAISVVMADTLYGVKKAIEKRNEYEREH